MTDIRQSPEYANYLSQIGWTVERVRGINYFIKKFPLLGAVLKIQRPEKIDFKEIERLRKKHRVFLTVVEPLAFTRRFKPSRSPYLPTKTLQLNLDTTRQKLLKNLKKDARSAIKRIAENNPLPVRNPEEFRKIWKGAVGLQRYVPPLSHLAALKKSFGKKCLFLVSKPPAGAMFLKCGEVAYYWQAFTGKEARRLRLQYKIVWEGILWAKKEGAKIFDFEGVYDERFPNRSWLGFTHFKKSFGGYEVLYPGSFVKITLPSIRSAK